GGEVRVSSPGPGQGSTFTFLLPLAQAPRALSPATPAAAPVPGALRVLIVEDNRDAAESLRMLMELLGAQATVAHTGPEGVTAARQRLPDLVLCDLGLPGLSGYE